MQACTGSSDKPNGVFPFRSWGGDRSSDSVYVHLVGGIEVEMVSFSMMSLRLYGTRAGITNVRTYAFLFLWIEENIPNGE